MQTIAIISDLHDWHSDQIESFLKQSKFKILKVSFEEIKFGFGRCTADSCIDIRRDALSRQQAIKLVSRFDDISKDLDLVLYAKYFEKAIVPMLYGWCVGLYGRFACCPL